MRKVELSDGFCVSGRIPGASKPDVINEVKLPFCLQDMQAECGQEGLFLRSWELYALVEKPEEQPHSHAERTLLTLDGVYGIGQLYIGEKLCGALEPHMELDITEELRSGCKSIRLHFPPQHPRMLDGERGRDLIASGGLISVMIRNIFHMRIDDVCIDRSGTIRVLVHAYGAGKIRLCLRLTREEKLIWSENSTVQLVVGDQEIIRKTDADLLQGGEVLRASADMGGEGCDARETICSAAKESTTYTAYFRTLPEESMLRMVCSAGFDGITLNCYPHERLRDVCSRLGLSVTWTGEEVKQNALLKDGDEYRVDREGCLTVPMRSDEERLQFRQAQRLNEAVLAQRVAGKAIMVLAMGRQRDVQDGIFDAQGQPRAALYALRSALGKYALWAEGDKKIYHPCEEFSQEIVLLCAEPDGAPAAVQVQLYAWDGSEIASRIFPICIRECAQRIGRLQAQLPWKGAQGLVLRMQCIREGRILAVGHAYYAFADERGERIPFPEADIAQCSEGGQVLLCNVSDAVAMGVSVVNRKKTLICHGAMLPQERIILAQTEETVVQYGNAVKKGGKKSVVQRVLRGVFGDQHASAFDP